VTLYPTPSSRRFGFSPWVAPRARGKTIESRRRSERPGDRAAIALDTGAIKLFDPVTNRAIGGYALSASS